MFNNELYVQGDQNVQVPAHLNFGKFLLNQFRLMGDKVALENGETGEKLTYREFAQYAVDLAVSLTKLGVSKGDIVALGSEKRIMFLPTALAVVFTGATYTPYQDKCDKAVLKHKLNISKPKYVICSKKFWDNNTDILNGLEFIKTFISLDESPASAIPLKSLTTKHYNVDMFEPATVMGQLDTAILLYTSGTTGNPKGVQLTHLNCILNSLPNEYKDESLKTGFVSGSWYHNYDTFMTYKYLVAGRKLVYVDDITPKTVLDCLEKCEVNIAFTVPFIITWLSKVSEEEEYNLKSLKIVYCRTSPLHVKTIMKIKQRFPSIVNILQGYGMTESGELTSENWGAKGAKPGSVGCPSPGITLKVVDPETRKVLGPNQRGEICLKGPVFMKGYINVDYSANLDEDGFFKTGDLGYYDEDKYFYSVERLKDIIFYDGHKIAPLELETILLLHPGVREVSVVGRPEPTFGEEPTAFVVRTPGSEITEQELIDHVASEVAPYMQLRGGVRFISQLPRNPRGKVLRRRLREMLI